MSGVIQKDTDAYLKDEHILKWRKVEMKLFKVLFMAAVILIQSQTVLANANIDSIYFASSGFCIGENSTHTEEKSVDEIMQNMIDYPGTEEYKITNGNIMMKVNDKFVEYKPTPGDYSRILNNVDIFDKLSDIQWLQDILYDTGKEYGAIKAVMYKAKYYEYRSYGYQNDLEAWVFTDNNIYIINLYNEDTDIEIKEILTFDEWQQNVLYRPVGECWVEDECLSQSVYFNKYEGSVPLRAVIESIGGTVEWDPDEYSAYITYNDEKYRFKYLFMENGFDNGGLVIDTEDKGMIPAGRVSGVGSGFVIDGTTYLSMLTAEKFFEKLGFVVAQRDGSVIVERKR